MSYFVDKHVIQWHICVMKLLVNREEIRKWTKSVGGTGSAVRMIMNETECSVQTADRIARGSYPSEPSYLMRKALLELTNLSEDVLFKKIEDHLP